MQIEEANKPEKLDRREFLRRYWGDGAGLLFAAGVSGVFGLMLNRDTIRREKEYESWLNRTVEMEVGRIYRIGNEDYKFYGMLSSISFGFANIYARAPPNFSASLDGFRYNDQKFKLENVTPEKLTITYLGKDK